MDIRHEIKLYAEQMSPGQTDRTICPVCRGGQSGEHSLTITVKDDMSVWYNCFRAACETTKGVLNISTSYNQTNSKILHKSEPLKKRKVFEGTTVPLTEYEKKYMRINWGIKHPHYWWHTYKYGQRIAMSVRSPLYTHRGWVLRSILGNCATKALTYIEDNEVPLSWYSNPEAEFDATVLVEDIPSAIRASYHVTKAVALLGTGCGIDRASEISKFASGPILIMLDQDATVHACNMLEKHGLLWNSTRGAAKVVPLKLDLKDMHDVDVRLTIKNALT